MARRGNGEGSVVKHKATGKYYGQYTKTNGKRGTTKYYATKKEAQKELLKIVAEIQNNTFIDKSNISLYAILENDIENKYSTGIIQARTYARDKGTLKLLKEVCKDFINKPIQKITIYDIKECLPNFLQGKKLTKQGEKIIEYSQNTINKLWGLLSRGFKVALDDRVISYNIMKNDSLKKPKSLKVTEPVEALTVEEHRKLLDILLNSEPDIKYADIMLLQLYTGMRIGEVLALTKDDIDLKNSTITVRRTLTRDKNNKTIMGKTTKTQSGKRTFDITYKTKQLCEKILKQKISNIEGLLFYDYNKCGYITPNQVNCYLQRLNEKYEITDHIHTHMLRHTFATRFIEAGGSAKALQVKLGHNKIEITLNTYASVLSKFSKDETEKYQDYLKASGLE